MAENKVIRPRDIVILVGLIIAIVGSLLLIIFPPFSLTGAGAFNAGGLNWEHQLQITADSSQQSITKHIVFDQYRTEDCRDIYIEANGQNIPFRNENSIVAEDGLCKETDVVFDNIIYNAQPTENFQTSEANSITYDVYYGKISAEQKPETLGIAPEQPSFGTQATAVTACTNLTSANTAYVLTQNIAGFQASGICLDIWAYNITLDCAGWNITGSGGTDEYAVMTNASNTTIRNCIIQRSAVGIQMQSSDNAVVYNNTIRNCSLYALTHNWGNNSNFSNNVVYYIGLAYPSIAWYGLYLGSGWNNTVANNVIFNLTGGQGIEYQWRK